MADAAAASPMPQAALRGPRGLPVLGNILAFGRDQLAFLTGSARQYGDIVPMNFAGWPALLVSDIDAIEHILVRDHRNFVKNELVWRHVRAIFGEGLLTSEGALWQRQRRLAAPPFAGRQLLGYDRVMTDLAAAMVDCWRDGATIDAHPEIMALTLRIAAKALFDADVDEDIAAMDHAVEDLIREIEARFKRPILIPDAVPLPGHLRYRRAIKTVEGVVAKMIADRRRHGLDGRADVLSRLMAARDDAGKPMSDALLRDEAVTMLLAGHETTALALSWSLYLVGRDPALQHRLVAEIEAAAPGRAVGADDVAHLPLTEAVIKETMRLYPPAWVIGRESVGPFALGRHQFGAKTTILISQWVLHRDRRHFDDPDDFLPERWLGGSLEKRLPRYAYMPFGGGPRICIGQRFAMIEAVLILATILRRFQVDWRTDRPITPFPSITLRPKGGVWLRLEARTSAAATRH